MNKTLLMEVVELTQQLIQIPSTHSRPKEISHCADFIEQWLHRHQINYHRFDSNNIPSICVMPKGPFAAELVLNAHFDVVECEDPALFHPNIDNGRLHGRGAVDDKYAVALSLILFRQHLLRLKNDGKTQQDMSFGLLLTGDEEIGGINGVGTIAPNLQTNFFIVLDGGRPDIIVTKEKGILLLELTTMGKSAHAARPWLGKNSFDLLIDDYLCIKALFHETSGNHWHKTMVLSQCKAGNGSTNMVPQTALATLDIRYTDRDDPNAIIESIRKVIRGSLRVIAQEPVFCSGSSPYLDTLGSSAKEAVFSTEHGSSDARHLSKHGIPGVIWGADGEMTQHTEKEFLAINSLVPLYQRLNDFLIKVEHNTAGPGFHPQLQTVLKN